MQARVIVCFLLLLPVKFEAVSTCVLLYRNSGNFHGC